MNAVQALLTSSLDGKQVHAKTGIVMTVDRGYVEEQMLDVVVSLGLGSTLIISDRILRFHTLFAASFLSPDREDEITWKINRILSNSKNR